MYTEDMKRYIQRSLPAEFFTHPAYLRALALGFVYLFLAITQLFTYEKFAGITELYLLPGDGFTTVLLAALIPLLEVASMPFLLSMKVSNRTYRISRVATIAVPSLWLLISLWLVLTADMTTESGLMGATLPVGSGLWLVAFAALLLWGAILVVRELPKRRLK
jgi:hypothetical protein